MSDDAEIVKAVVQGTVEGLITPFTGLLERLFGFAADEAGLVLGDAVGGMGAGIRSRMQLRRERFLGRTQCMLNAMQTEAQQVPLKILIPIIQNASLEEDDDLQDRWAALLANNAAGKYLQTTFSEILRQLASADAYLLRACFHEVLATMEKDELNPWSVSVDGAISKWQSALTKTGPISFPVSELSVENLTRLGLLERNDLAVNMVRQHDKLTKLGYNFAIACENPAEIKPIFAGIADNCHFLFDDFGEDLLS